MSTEELHALLKEAVDESLQTIESLRQRRTRKVFQRVVEPDFLADGSIRKVREVRRPDVFAIQHVLINLTAVSRLCQFVAGSDLLAQLVTERVADSSSDQIFRLLFLPFLDHYLTHVASLDFDENAFKVTYEGLMQYFCSDTVTLLFLAPLLGFNMETKLDSMSLESNISIDRVSTRLKKQLWDDAPSRRSISVTDIYDLNYQATLREQVPKHNLLSYRENIDEDIENLQALLRLVKQEPISVMCVILNSSPWFLGPFTDLMAPTYYPWPTIDPIVGRYVSILAPSQSRVIAEPFSDEEMANLKKFWNVAKNAKQWSRLTLALRRLSFTYDRFVNTDKLVDCWIALEALFKKESEANGIGTLVAKRLASLPGMCSNRNERKRMEKLVANSYECRKAVVHGQYGHDSGYVRLKGGSELRVVDCCKTAQDCLERSLKIILSKDINLDTLCNTGSKIEQQ